MLGWKIKGASIMLDSDKIKRLLKDSQVTPDNAFQILQSICSLASRSQGESDSDVQSLVLRALDRREDFGQFSEILNGLIRHFGLYPYLNADTLTVKDALAREFHRPGLLSTSLDDRIEKVGGDEGLIFHRVQAKVFRHLLDGESIVLSAPTSFGKSALIDALIESGQFENIVIVVPTIALIDETRRRLAYLKETHKIITHATQELVRRNIFILTQERAVDFPNLPDIDLFVLDEFYKLDPRGDEQRAMTLNLAFYKLMKKAQQFYLLGPSIQNIPDGFPGRFKCQFIRTDFATVVTELISVKAEKGGEMDKLLDLCNEVNGPTLIFCASPNKARKIVGMIAEKSTKPRKGMPDAAKWAGENYHPEWTLVKGLHNGVGMHHGCMPRSLAQLCVKGFNEGKLPFLVCTSTLIEGVNTKAKNVIIFDNKIAGKKYDFFTFNNIRGRSGRMFKHFIGNVYLFHEPPQEALPSVEVPVFSQDENTKESLLIQLDDPDLQSKSRRRLEPYHVQNFLSIDVIRQNTGIEPRDQIALACYLLENPSEMSKLAWNGYPTWDRLLILCETIWNFFVKEIKKIGGVSSEKQLAFKINQMRKTSLKSVIKQAIEKGTNPDDAVEAALEFIRQWPQYRFPRLAMGVCRIQNAIAERMKEPNLAADYRFFCGEVENLFSDAALVALDEYGLPFPLAKMLEKELNSDGSLDKALQNLSRLSVDTLHLTSFEKSLIEDVKKSI
jgi:hypothetical protein